jgi:type IV secretion system protein VirB5
MNTLTRWSGAVLLGLGCAGAQAQGIPVIDAANLVQAVQQVVHDITQINNQVQQILRLQQQLDSINGSATSGRCSTTRCCATTCPPRPTRRSTPWPPPATAG